LGSKSEAILDTFSFQNPDESSGGENNLGFESLLIGAILITPA
jgi:hypothetical protein